MGVPGETLEQTARPVEGAAPAVPGIVVVVEAGQPAHRAFAVTRAGLEFGRRAPAGAFEADERVSRKHVRVSCALGRWGVQDLGSRNGTFVNGARIDGFVELEQPALIRIGNSLLWTLRDVTPFLEHEPRRGGEGPVVGALLARAWDEIAAASRAGDTLLIRGETGSGKELAARHMHEVSFGTRSTAPFLAVNCAAIPQGLAERLLFGAKRGAYSGAEKDAEGYLVAADRGTLFLDEIAELDLLVQAKLLRVLETREVLPLGDSRPRPVRVRIAAATHQNLREAVSAGRFRQDLYFRIGRPEVALPPLRERVDELPWLIAAELRRARADRVASVGFIEACALRPWPGNVRELLREVRLAAHSPLAEGSEIGVACLAAEAGIAIEGKERSTVKTAPTVSDEANIQAALAAHGGNVTRAAQALGLHRNQLRRWLAKHPDAAPGCDSDGSDSDGAE
jgi:transcriptional regulator of acetoin/glycerol metabolism